MFETYHFSKRFTQVLWAWETSKCHFVASLAGPKEHYFTVPREFVKQTNKQPKKEALKTTFATT